MARKFLTMDGNEAAAHAAYAYTEVATTFSARRFRLQRCSLKQAQQALFMAPSQPVL